MGAHEMKCIATLSSKRGGEQSNPVQAHTQEVVSDKHDTQAMRYGPQTQGVYQANTYPRSYGLQRVLTVVSRHPRVSSSEQSMSVRVRVRVLLLLLLRHLNLRGLTGRQVVTQRLQIVE